MSERALKSNQDLSDFLTWLTKWLKDNKRLDLVEHVLQVTGSAFTTSSEFLGETRIALSKVKAGGVRALSKSVDEDIASAISQIDAAFRKANGFGE